MKLKRLLTSIVYASVAVVGTLMVILAGMGVFFSIYYWNPTGPLYGLLPLLGCVGVLIFWLTLCIYLLFEDEEMRDAN